MHPAELGPFADTPLEEVPLTNAPLVSVLSQIKWPQVTDFRSNLNQLVERFGKEVLNQYPLYEEQQEIQLIVNKNGPSPMPGGKLFQFKTKDEDWTITLSESFLALETKRYESREDFAYRLTFALEALSRAATIPLVDRIGFRYINRIDQPAHYEELASFVRPEALGGGNIPTGPTAHLVHSLNESVYKIGPIQLLVRSAFLPPGATIDPTIQGSTSKSWILDLDAAREERIPFDAQRISVTASDLALTAYRYFKWVVTDEFVATFK